MDSLEVSDEKVEEDILGWKLYIYIFLKMYLFVFCFRPSGVTKIKEEPRRCQKSSTITVTCSTSFKTLKM